MYEVLESIKDSRYKDRIIYIILSESDKKYYKEPPSDSIGANIYTMDEQTQYILYWCNKEEELKNQISKIGNPAYAISHIKEHSIIQKILIDMPEFFEFIKDYKGINLTTHINENFSSIIRFMGLEEDQ